MLSALRQLRERYVFHKVLQEKLGRAHREMLKHKAEEWSTIGHFFSVHHDSLSESQYYDCQVIRNNTNIHRIVSTKETFPFSVYSVTETSGRPHQVWRYDHSCHSDTLIFEEKDECCTVDIAVTRDGEYITINSNSHTSSEVHLMVSHDLSCDPILVKQRCQMVEYYMEHAHNKFYIFTNIGQCQEYQIMTAESFEPQAWKSFYKPMRGFVFHDLEVYANHVILYGWKNTAPVIIVMDPEGYKKPTILCDEGATSIEKPTINIGFQSEHVPVWFTSPFQLPYCVLPNQGSQAGPIYRSSLQTRKEYLIERVQATNDVDGTKVPITLCYHRNKVKPDNRNPVLVHVYGCYGENIPLGYRPEHEQLLSMGWVLAFCHVRGGGEKGRKWYYEGRGRNKMNSFQDLRACVQHLQNKLNLSQPRLTAMTGRSAGGHTVGMFCNLWPELVQAVVLKVPFVNVVDTLMQSPLHINQMDYGEFGPQCSIEKREVICPYSTLKPQDYPSFYIAASKYDHIIPIADVHQYIVKLRQCVRTYRRRQKGLEVCDEVLRHHKLKPLKRGTVIFRELVYQGHYESDNIIKKYKEIALQTAFLHRALGLTMEFTKN